MNKICECANNFNNMLMTRYEFTIVSNRKLKRIVLDFKKADFRHVINVLHFTGILIIRNNATKNWGFLRITVAFTISSAVAAIADGEEEGEAE